MARAAIRYAKALLSLAVDQKKAEAVNADMLHIAQTIAANDELGTALKSAVIKAEDKKQVVTKIFGNIDATSKDLFDLLIQNKRFALLEDISIQFGKLYKQHIGQEVAVVTTAVSMTNDLEIKVLAKIKELTNKSVAVENIVDETILGGFILRIGDKEYNASVANKLNRLKREFTLN